MEMHHISGEAFGIKYFLRESGPIDFSRNYEWTEKYEDRKIFTFDQACDILDNEFHEGDFNGIGGIIVPEQG